MPSLEVVKHGALALQTSGFLRRTFSRECREAKRLYKSLVGSRQLLRKEKTSSELARLAAYLQQLHETETNRDLPRYAGRFYRGLETPWRDLISVSQWAGKVRQAFPPLPNGKSPICVALLEAEAGAFDSILAFGKSPNTSVLPKNCQSGSANSAPSLEALVDAESAAAVLAEDLVLQPFRRDLECRSNIRTIGSARRGIEITEDLVSKLNSEKVEKLLGSHGELWADRAAQLRETGNYLSELGALGFPQAFWQRLSQQPSHELIASLKRQGEQLTQLTAAVREHEEAACNLALIDGRRWIGADDMRSANLKTLEARIGFAIESKANLQPYLDFLRVESQAKATPLASILESFQDSADPYKNLDKVFDIIFYRSCAESLLREDPKLGTHSGETHEKLRRRYQQLDRKILELRRQEISRSLMNLPIPSGVGKGRASEFSDLALIRRQISLQRRHIALRELLRRAGDAVQALKPCFMMSPMSVAQFLDPEGLRFDLVVMDEASQIRPEDAIGAIVRGTQIVVVGDPKQLPPTPFFEKVDRDDTSEEDSDEAEVEDLIGQESILDLARGPYQPVRRLGWHYRSQHEGLIAFSNREFYEGKLTVFPSPHGDHPHFGVRIEEVAGIYGDSLNPIEAEVVVAAAQTFMRQFPKRSLGIVTMNKPQQELIQKMMDDLFATDVEAEVYRLRMGWYATKKCS